MRDFNPEDRSSTAVRLYTILGEMFELLSTLWGAWRHRRQRMPRPGCLLPGNIPCPKDRAPRRPALRVIRGGKDAQQPPHGRCTDCNEALPYACITPLCDDCLSLTCPALDCESGAQVMIGRHDNGCPRYECQDCRTEWSNAAPPSAAAP